MAKTIITEKSFRDAYKKFQREFKNIGTDEQFAAYLNKNYKTQTGKLFSTGNVASLRNKLEIKTPVASGPNPALAKRFEAITNYSTKEIDKANNSLKYLRDVDIKAKVIKKFNLESFPNFKTAYYPYLAELDSLPKKIDKALNSMLQSDQPLKKPMVNQVMKLTGMSLDGIRDNINKSEVYQNIKESADVIKRSKGMPPDFYKLPFSEQLIYATKFNEGMPRYTGMGNEVKYSAKPQNKIMEFALRNWNNNKGSGQVQYFNKGSNKPIKWERGKKLPWDKVDFSYGGQRHSFTNLRSPQYMEQYFPELYEKVKRVNNLNAQMVDNPFIPGKKISNRDLIKQIQVEGYKWKPRRGTIDILHGRSGVTNKPFTDLTYAASDLNKFEAALDTSYKAGNLSKVNLDNSVKIVRRSVEGLSGDALDKSIINRSVDQAKLIQSGGFRDFRTLREAALEEAIKGGPICNPFRNKGGRIGFADGTGCVSEVRNALDTDPVKFAKDINKTEGILPKVKNFATKFLNVAKADYNLMGKFGKFGAVAGLGAAAAGVKEFFSDDPTSYLSNEKQQKNMLIDMVTEPIAEPTEKPAILEAQMPVLGATLLAGTIPGAKDTYLDAITGRGPKGPVGSGLPANIENKPVGKFRAALGINKGVLGKGLAAIGTPAGLLATEPFFIGNQIAEGDSIGEIATNPMNYLGAAFASPLTKMATKNVGPTTANIMRLGLSPARLAMLSRFGQFGLAAGLGIAGVNLFNDYRNKEGFFEKDNVGPARFDQQTGIGGVNFD